MSTKQIGDNHYIFLVRPGNPMNTDKKVLIDSFLELPLPIPTEAILVARRLKGKKFLSELEGKYARHIQGMDLRARFNADILMGVLHLRTTPDLKMTMDSLEDYLNSMDRKRLKAFLDSAQLMWKTPKQRSES